MEEGVDPSHAEPISDVIRLVVVVWLSVVLLFIAARGCPLLSCLHFNHVNVGYCDLCVAELCHAATKIQASFRGHVARKAAGKVDEELSKDMAKLDAKVSSTLGARWR